MVEAMMTYADVTFMHKLDIAGVRPRDLPGGSEQIENATRQRCRRRGWVTFGNKPHRGWLLTEAGRLALAQAQRAAQTEGGDRE